MPKSYQRRWRPDPPPEPDLPDVWPNPDAPDPGDVEWVGDDPGRVKVGEIAVEIADETGVSFVEAASAVFETLPADYRTPHPEEDPA